MHVLKRFFLLAIALSAWSTADDPRGSSALACFAVVVGREASTDGSVLVGHNEQDNGVRILSFCRLPSQESEPGAEVRLRRGGTLPEVRRTAAALWSQCPLEEFADRFLNEHGVCIVSDRCRTRQDDYETLVARGEIRDGGIGWMLRRLVAQRARTAREGVELAGQLVERFGYVDNGRTYVIADPREAWLLAVVGGRQWVAARVPDDAVVLLPNVHVIREVNLKDTKNFLGSADVVDYAIARGWYDPSSGEPFDFRKAYRLSETPEPDPPDSRRWDAFRIVTGTSAPWPPAEPIPLAVKPRMKLSVTDVATILRDRGEGTRRPISSDNTIETEIFQLRDGLPRAIGCIWWQIRPEPTCGALVPWYLGVRDVPACYARPEDLATRLSADYHFNPPAGTFEPDATSAFWKFQRLADWVHADYAARIGRVRPAWAALEQKALAMQAQVEAEALELYRSDPAAAAERLTRHCAALAEEACRTADRLAVELGIKTLER